MPLNVALRMTLDDMLAKLRPDWDREAWHRASVDKAALTLAADPRSPFDLIVQAVTQAQRNPNSTPECITWPLTDEPANAPVMSQRQENRPRCELHGSDLYGRDGRFICCIQEAAEQRPARHPAEPVMSGRCGPPPSVKAELDRMRAEWAKQAAVRVEGER